jgi:Halobacterial output domain 1
MHDSAMTFDTHSSDDTSHESTTLSHTHSQLSDHIVNAIAARKQCSIDKLPPLYDHVDPDALNALFAPLTDGTPRSTGQVAVAYAGYHVVVAHDGAVELTPLSDLE